MSKSIVKEESFKFAVRIIRFYQYLKENRKGFVLRNQILRSGTSIGANVREALNAESTADFIHKMAIAQKEADESLYWLELFHATGFIEENQFESLHTDGSKLLKMIRSIILTKKANRKNNS